MLQVQPQIIKERNNYIFPQASVQLLHSIIALVVLSNLILFKTDLQEKLLILFFKKDLKSLQWKCSL
jgi:hypothetical protein